jgi:hypothetical protein
MFIAENVKKIAITTDNKLPLLRGIDQVCSKIQKAKYLNNKCTKRHYCRALYYSVAILSSSRGLCSSSFQLPSRDVKGKGDGISK